MRLTVLALDYDGTIAHENRVDDDMRAAIREVRRRGIATLLVTGRRLDDLRRDFGDLRVFDAVVAENGAVLLYPSIGHSTPLGSPPNPALLHALQQQGIEFAAGECVVEADATEAERILRIIRALELPLVLAFNRGRLMVLPQAISKATGLREALTALRLSTHNAIAIGDAENDHEMLAACELGVAVGWGSRALQVAADEVLEGEGPADVARFIREATGWGKLPWDRIRRRRLPLGHREDGTPLYLPMRGRNLLVAGDSHSGKSWLTGLVCERLILQRYSLFIIDPEGDYTQLEALPGVIVMGGEGHPPRVADVARLLHHHDVSIVADLSTLSQQAKRYHVAALLRLVLEHRRRTGLPHRVVVDEAHYFVDHADALRMVDLDAGGYTFVTYRASRLRPEVLDAAEAIIVTRATDPDEVETLLDRGGVGDGRAYWAHTLNTLALDEAVLIDLEEQPVEPLCKFRSGRRLTLQVRHRHKYFDVPVAEHSAFVFTRHGNDIGVRARSLKQLLEAMDRVPDDVIDGHVRRHDFSRWVDDVFGDYMLAGALRDVEARRAAGKAIDVRQMIAERVKERYAVPLRAVARTPAAQAPLVDQAADRAGGASSVTM